MLRQALSILPAQPAIVLAPCVILLVILFYYSDRYQTCHTQADFRYHFMRTINEASTGVSASVDLVAATDFSWDTVQILTGYKPKLSHVQSCPFAWDWNKEKLRYLADSGRLTMLVFTDKGRISRYLELDSALINFSQVKNNYSSGEATFKVSKDAITDTLLIQEQ